MQFDVRLTRNHTCIGNTILPRYVTRITQHETMRSTVGDERNCTVISHIWIKRNLFNVFYMGGVCATSFLIHVQHWYFAYIMYWCWTIKLKKSRCYRPKFWFINNYSRTLPSTNVTYIVYWGSTLTILKCFVII